MPGSQPQPQSDADKQAWSIFEQICATSEDRPFAGRDAATLMAQVADWKARNPGLIALQKAAPDVRLAFLEHSLEWLRAESKGHFNFRRCDTVADATRLALRSAPSPLPHDLILHLLSDFRQEFGMARFYFPLEPLLNVIRREDVTEEIRVELKKLVLQFAPSPTGKVDENALRIRNRILELARVEGERQLDAGRGPWSQIVFDGLATRDELLRSAWEGLLGHCRSLEQTVPGAKWRKRAHELMAAIGEEEAAETMRQWLALGPTPGQPPEARSPIEDSAYQKGIVWCLLLSPNRDTAIAVADFGIACLRKIAMLGAVSQKVGFASVQALGEMRHDEAVSQLTRLRIKVKYTVARRLIEKSLRQAAGRAGVTLEEWKTARCPASASIAMGAARSRWVMRWRSSNSRPTDALPRCGRTPTASR